MISRERRRELRTKVISRRLRIIREAWSMTAGLQESGESVYAEFSNPGRLSKYNLTCQCSMCQTKTNRDGWKHGDLKRRGQTKNWKGTDDCQEVNRAVAKRTNLDSK